MRQLYEKRPTLERTEAGIFLFYRWLRRHYPELLPRSKGDSLEKLKTDLKGLFSTPKPGRLFPRWSKLCS